MAKKTVVLGLSLLGCLVLAGCPESDGGCADGDGDGFGAGCVLGVDADDTNPNVWMATATCVDTDGDSSFVGCDAYATVAGPDCDDTDVDNQSSCSTCLDGDSDGSFAGCDAYTVRSGPDCDDADVDNQSSCSTCLDGDGDGGFVGCDAYTTRIGPDCDDVDHTVGVGLAPNDSSTACMRDADNDDWGDAVAPTGGVAGTDCDDANFAISPSAGGSESLAGCYADFDFDGYGDTTAPPGGLAGTDCDDLDSDNWASCASCVDADLDLSFESCDAYVDRSGPDCDAADPRKSTAFPELADDGIDNDCSGTDLVASAGAGVYVDGANGSCTDGAGAGSQATPFCTLSAAIAAHLTGGDLFVAAGTYVLTDAGGIAGGVVTPLRIYGGYDSSWNRDLATNTTLVQTGPTATAYGLFYSSNTDFVLDGFEWDRPGTNEVRDLELQTLGSMAVTRSSFSRTNARNGYTLTMSGFSTLASTQSEGLVSDVRFETTGDVSQIALANRLDEFVVENSEFDMRGNTNSVLALRATVNDGYIVNNTWYSDGGYNPLVGGFEGSKLLLANNSIVQTALSGFGVMQLSSSETVLVNNAVDYPNGGRLALAAAPGYAADADISLLNNSLDRGLFSYFDYSQPSGGFFSLANATAANGCPFCLDAGGNIEGEPGFVDPALGDFSLTGSSALIDAGTDPSTLVPYFRVFEDKDGVARPRDGDAVGGAEWDIGAYER
ncbi:MAG: hypothetical protein AAGC67_12480 [Myxococcota bacterium]